MTSSWLSHDLGTIYRPGTKWGLDLISQVLQALLSTNSDMLDWQKKLIKDIIMNITWSDCSLQTWCKMRTWFNVSGSPRLSRNLAAIYIPDTKWGPDLVSQVPHTPLPSNFVRYGGDNKRISSIMPSYLSGGFGTICRSGIPNKDQSWYLRLHIHHHLETFLGILGWQTNFISDIFMVVTWLCYNLQTMCKMRSRYSISSSTYTIAFKLCQISWENKRISLKM